jgi:asparagine synthase (glutamine-hydrolysing)
LETFAVGFEGAPDLEAARSVARSLGTRHHECVYTQRDVEHELERIVYHLESYDPALIRSAVPCYFVSRLAAEYVKVVLTGEGADEVFAGYRYFSRFRDGPSLQRECVRLLLGLHAMNLQRVDRMTMAHGIEGRVPFLDVALVEWAMGLDPKLKLHAPGVPEKQLLRSALTGLVPNEALVRPKQEFAEGAGAEAVLEAYAERVVSDFDFERAGTRFPVDTPVTKEEFLYRAIFEDLFPAQTVRHTVSRWRGSA